LLSADRFLEKTSNPEDTGNAWWQLNPPLFATDGGVLYFSEASAMETSNTPLLSHGGYRGLRSYKVAEAVYDATVAFCRRFSPMTGV
jgi:hypothetical protein